MRASTNIWARPIPAETFCDIERTAGTCYKAAGWIPLGQTQGFTRVNCQDCDFYIPNGRPKAVWAKPLCKDALDGKFVKEVMGVVSVVNAETGAPGSG